MEKLEEIYNKINNLNYLLDRKIELLNIILNITENQKIVFEEKENDDTKPFINIALQEKQKLIDEIVSIDNMFISIFESFNGELNENKKFFKDDILNIKEKIQQITDIDFKIRLKEEKNKSIQERNINSIATNIDKIKTLKVSKNHMLKKYMDNSKNI